MQNSLCGRVPSIVVSLAPLLLATFCAATAKNGALLQAGYYENPVVNAPAPDPGVLYYSGSYYAVTTGTFGPNAFPLRRSPDLVQWEQVGWVFPEWMTNKNPQWGASDFWAPELHLVDQRFVVYFAARNSDGLLCVGAATSNSATGPFKDIGAPLVLNKSELIYDHWLTEGRGKMRLTEQ